MTDVWVVTGPPGCGKTTVLVRTADRLVDRGWAVDGLLAPERREDGSRVGFEIVSVGGHCGGLMASTDRRSGPAVGRYRVDTTVVDRVSQTVLSQARREADVVVIDELGPMQFTSRVFIEEVRRALTSETPTVVTVKETGALTRLAAVTAGELPEPIQVTEQNRDQLPDQLADEIDAALRR